MLDPKPDAEREKANPEPGVCLRVGGSDFESKKRELLLLESIDQGLVDLLGRRARDAIYDHLERKCFMAREEIPQRLGEFCNVLRFNFGKQSRGLSRSAFTLGWKRNSSTIPATVWSITLRRLAPNRLNRPLMFQSRLLR